MVAESFSKRLSKALDYAGVPGGRERRLAVSRMFGVSREAVRKWLAGESIPDTKRLPEIAKLLGVRAEWLITGAGGMESSSEPPSEHTLSPRISLNLRRIWQLAVENKLSPDDVALLAKVAIRLATDK